MQRLFRLFAAGAKDESENINDTKEYSTDPPAFDEPPQDSCKVFITEGNLATDIEKQLPSAFANNNHPKTERVRFDEKSNRVIIVDNWKRYNRNASGQYSLSKKGE